MFRGKEYIFGLNKEKEPVMSSSRDGERTELVFYSHVTLSETRGRRSPALSSVASIHQAWEEYVTVDFRFSYLALTREENSHHLGHRALLGSSEDPSVAGSICAFSPSRVIVKRFEPSREHRNAKVQNGGRIRCSQCPRYSLYERTEGT